MNVVDHVLYAVRDLDDGAAMLRERYGLGSVPGGEPAPGVRNAVVPLEPPLYLELITVTDPDAGPQAARLAQRLAEREGLYTFAVDPDDIDAEAARLAAPTWGTPGAPWRLLGDVGPDAPFYIAYPDGRERRAHGWRGALDAARHDVAVGGFTFLELGDGADLREWVGDVDVDVRWVDDGGPPGLRRVGLAVGDGELVLG